MKSLSVKLGVILVAMGFIAILNCSMEPPPERQSTGSTAGSIDVLVVRTEVAPSGSFRVYYKVTNSSRKDIKSIKLTCILLNSKNEDIAFGNGVLENIPKEDSAYDWIPINVSPSEVHSVKFRIDKVYY